MRKNFYILNETLRSLWLLRVKDPRHPREGNDKALSNIRDDYFLPVTGRSRTRCWTLSLCSSRSALEAIQRAVLSSIPCSS